MKSDPKETLLVKEQESHPLKGIVIYLIASFLNVFSRIMSKQA